MKRYICRWSSAALAVERYGGPGVFSEILINGQYVIEVRQTAACVVNEKILAHARGYNQVSIPAIEDRFGKDFFTTHIVLPDWEGTDSASQHWIFGIPVAH